MKFKQKFSILHIDLMASSSNNQPPNFVFWKADTFPPFILIG